MDLVQAIFALLRPKRPRSILPTCALNRKFKSATKSELPKHAPYPKLLVGVTIHNVHKICLSGILDDGNIDRAWTRDGARMEFLKAGQVHVWGASIPALVRQLPAFESVISADERARGEGYFHEDDRRRFVAGRGLLRRLLSSYLETPANQLKFKYESFGKPTLGHALRFNLSHSDALILVALAWRNDVGIDIEKKDGRAGVLKLAARYFSAEEHEQLLELPESERSHAFYRMWTSKEAFVKAAGVGLCGFIRFGSSFGMDGGRDPSAGRHTSPWSDGSDRVIELPIHRDYCAAVAVTTGILQSDLGSLSSAA